MPTLTVAEIAHHCEGVVEGDPNRIIVGANALEAAGPSELSFAGASPKLQIAAANSRAGCLLVGQEFNASGEWSLVRVREPRAAFVRALKVLYPKPRPVPFIHPAAVIAGSAYLGSDCFVGAYAMIGEDTKIGAGCYLAGGSHIGARIEIGEHTTIHPNVTLYDDVKIGSRVILHAGCVIGADGFGFAMSGDHYEKFPQVGTVIIEDDVEIGANCCIDRAALGATRIGRGTKIDNLVHIAHNCDVGKHVVIAAQTGFAGGVTIGDYAILGGQVGIGEKATVASRAIVGSRGGILSFKTVDAGEPVWGVPARPLRQHLKGLANISKIPDLRQELLQVKKRLNKLETHGSSDEHLH
ncbi:MAG: UDP-3-O-(3-hydroxymyristoyl)glucosamine N-acyltransferase [Acidobacteriota bacterium]|nr:UDP-3-O-(3-hydroxymyristoyl)glucosamine N-acyltransferase [Acidobacteriota bacterium]